MPDSLREKEWEEALTDISKWCDELDASAQSHQSVARRIRNINRFLGGLNVALAAFTATTMYAALNKQLQDLSPTKQILITAIAVLPAIAAGLQKEWQLAAREQGHVLLAQACRVLFK